MQAKIQLLSKMCKPRVIVPTLFLWAFFTSHAKADSQIPPSVSSSGAQTESLNGKTSSSNSTKAVKVFEHFNENNCEVQKSNFLDNSSYECMSCTIIVSSSPIQAANVEEPIFGAFLYRFKLETEMRFVCPDLHDPASCEIRPVFTITKRRGRNQLNAEAPQQIEGFEIGIDQKFEDGNTSMVFLELDIDHTEYEKLGYPDIVVEYVPTFTFKPSSNYEMSLFTLPKIQSHGLDAWDETHEVKTPEMPSENYLSSLTDDDIGHWHQKRLLCSDKVWCFRGKYCNMGPYVEGEEHKGVMKSFIIAISICFLILWFFFMLVTLARNRVRRLNRHGDTEYLYDEDDDLFDDDDGLPKRTNDTEMLELSKQQEQMKSPSTTIAPETAVHFKDDRQKTSLGGDFNRSTSHVSGELQSARIEVKKSEGGGSYSNSSYSKPNGPETLVSNGISLQFETTDID